VNKEFVFEGRERSGLPNICWNRIPNYTARVMNAVFAAVGINPWKLQSFMTISGFVRMLH